MLKSRTTVFIADQATLARVFNVLNPTNNYATTRTACVLLQTNGVADTTLWAVTDRGTPLSALPSINGATSAIVTAQYLGRVNDAQQFNNGQATSIIPSTLHAQSTRAQIIAEISAILYVAINVYARTNHGNCHLLTQEAWRN